MDEEKPNHDARLLLDVVFPAVVVFDGGLGGGVSEGRERPGMDNDGHRPPEEDVVGPDPRPSVPHFEEALCCVGVREGKGDLLRLRFVEG